MATTYLNGLLVSSSNTNVDVVGGAASDTIVSLGDLADSTLNGSFANDAIAYVGGTANDVLFDGATQDDYIVFNSFGFPRSNLNNVTVFGGTGSDGIYFGGSGSISGFSGDYVNITDSLVRGAGNGDTSVGSDGSDYIFFGEDTIVTRTLVNGNEGNDFILAAGVNYASTIQGGKGNDYIAYSDADASRINGNLGNDALFAFGAEVRNGSSIFGGQGDDYLSFVDSPVTDSLVNGDVGADYIVFATDDYLGLLARNATILGGTDADFIQFAGDDYLFFSSEPAYVISTLVDGGEGNDYILVGEDTRVSQGTINGGIGNDYIFVREGSFGNGFGGLWNSIVDGGQGNDYIDVRNIQVGAGVTSIFGGEGSDTLYGNSDPDTGGAVGAYWSGDNGNDVIEATDGKDTILGGAGNDRIDGEEGGDLLTGGTGNDTFEYWTGNDSYVTGDSALLGSNIDTITDFDATVDRFNVHYTVASVVSVSAGFSTDWQTTVNTALGSGGALVNNGVAILTITTQANAGTYMLYQDSQDGFWTAGDDGIVALGTPTGTVSLANFVV